MMIQSNLVWAQSVYQFDSQSRWKAQDDCGNLDQSMVGAEQGTSLRTLTPRSVTKAHVFHIISFNPLEYINEAVLSLRSIFERS